MCSDYKKKHWEEQERQEANKTEPCDHVVIANE
jgi:hypothetical protein